MHLGQIKPNGSVIAAVFESGAARPIPGHTMVDLIRRAEAEGAGLTELASQLASRHAESQPPALPIHPREVWGCGFPREAREQDRPEIYLKGTSRICVGPGAAVGIRGDSNFTAPGPELAVVLGSRGSVIGYTLANNVSARDIERENPVYRPQARAFHHSCALGPAIVTADQLPEPYDLEIACVVEREGAVLFSGTARAAALRRLDVLIGYLLRSNPVPSGSVMLTGSGMEVPREAALRPGDVVSIRAAGIGELVSRVEAV